MRILIETHGCRSNYADSVELEAFCRERGWGFTDDYRNADVYLLNTCSVTDTAERDAYRALRRIKRRNPELKVVVTGCLAEINAGELLKTGLVDRVVGTGRLRDVISALGLNATGVEETSLVQLPASSVLPTRKQARSRRSLSLKEPLTRFVHGPQSYSRDALDRSRFHLRVQEGCENSCTYCIIPFTRGGLSSRQPQMILDDLRHLYSIGFREVVLTGTHLGGFGLDIGTSFLELLRFLASESPVERIRLSSLDPNDVSPELIDVLAGSGMFCEHLHLCFQSFSNRILRLMGRRYTLSQALSCLSDVEKRLYNWTLGTDIIAGFPGETEDEVAEAMALYKQLPFGYLHVFPYSARKGTPAERLPGQLNSDVCKERARRWRELDEKKRSVYRRGYIGQVLEVVLERVSGNEATGTSREYLPVLVKLGSAGCRERQGEVVKVVAFDYDQENGRLLCE